MAASTSEYRTFVKGSLINTTSDRVQRFHEDPKTLAKLTPPPVILQLWRDARRSNAEGEIEFIMWLGPFPIPWVARHEPGPTPHSFADRQVKGPMAYWRHEHIFIEKAGGVELLDRIVMAHRRGLVGLITRLLFDGMPLRILFAYRHRRTRMALQPG